jgi:hypothetical protein
LNVHHQPLTTKELMSREVWFLKNLSHADKDVLKLFSSPNPYRLIASSRLALPSNDEIYDIIKETKGALLFPPGGFPNLVNVYKEDEFNISFLDHVTCSVVFLDSQIKTLVYHSKRQKIGVHKCAKVIHRLSSLEDYRPRFRSSIGG